MPLLITILFRAVVELLKYRFQLCGNWQAEMGRILHKGNTLIGQIKENDCGPQHTSRTEDLHVHQVADADQNKNQDLFEDAPEADLRGQLLIHDGAHNPGEVVQNYEGQQCVQQAVAPTEEVAQPATDSGEDKLDSVPKFFHDDVLL